MFVADAFGNVQAQTLATVGLQLPGENTATLVMVVVGLFLLNLLGLDVLKGKMWIDDKGRNWTFGTSSINMRLLPAAPLLPPSQLTNVKPYLLPLGAQEEITPLPEELKE